MKIGVALGGGAAYGYAHVGVIKVLEREGVDISMIAGSSVGSLIAAIYASVMDAKKLEEIALSLDWTDIAMPTIPKEGLVSMERLGDFLKKKDRAPQYGGDQNTIFLRRHRHNNRQ